MKNVVRVLFAIMSLSLVQAPVFAVKKQEIKSKVTKTVKVAKPVKKTKNKSVEKQNNDQNQVENNAQAVVDKNALTKEDKEEVNNVLQELISNVEKSALLQEVQNVLNNNNNDNVEVLKATFKDSEINTGIETLPNVGDTINYQGNCYRVLFATFVTAALRFGVSDVVFLVARCCPGEIRRTINPCAIPLGFLAASSFALHQFLTSNNENNTN